MAERYALYEIEKLRDRFQLANGVPAGVKRNYNISPTQLGSVIINRDGVNVLERMNWGLLPANAKDNNSVFRYKTHLAKFEGTYTPPARQELICHSRCLIPANGFYEWHKAGDDTLPFYIRPSDQDLFAFAGIYSSWTDAEGNARGTYAILTDLYDRGPKKPLQRAIILKPADEAEWLNPTLTDIDAIYSLTEPMTDDALRIHEVSPNIRNVKATGDQLIHAIK